MPNKEGLAPESWKSLFVVGLLFPLHIVLGLVLIPLLFYLVASGSLVALAVLVVYLPFYLYPAQQRYPGWKGFELLWRLLDYTTTCPSYFGEFAVHGGENVDSEQQYFMACHPHGTLIFQRTFWRTAAMQRLFKRDWRMLGASAIFRIPLMREVSLFFGAVDASRSNCHRLLRHGVNVVVWPGGLDEANAVSTSPDGVEPVVLRTRTGFIRLALEHGVPVLPIFVFGELEAVRAISLLPAAVADWIKRRLRMSSTIFVGRWRSIVPFRVPFHLCIGKPVGQPGLRLSPVDQPDQFEAAVARMHADYKAQIVEIYESNKHRFGYAQRPLRFACEQAADHQKND